jgi:hypothetical protein
MDQLFLNPGEHWLHIIEVGFLGTIGGAIGLKILSVAISLFDDAWAKVKSAKG